MMDAFQDHWRWNRGRPDSSPGPAARTGERVWTKMGAGD